MRKWIVIVILVLLAGLIGFRVVNAVRVKNASRNRPALEKIIPVSLVMPERREITETIHASGSLSADNEVTLYSKVQGKIRNNPAKMGSLVKPDQAVSIVIRDEIGFEFQPHEVKSDVRGFISKVFLNPGATVSPSTPIMTLVDIDTVKAVASVDELQIRFIRIGQGAKVLVQAYPGETFFGRVSSISPVCNPVNRTVDIEIRIPNPAFRLKPGMYAEAEFIRDRRNVWMLPVTAVVEKAGQKTVFHPQGGKAVSILVETGSVLEDAVEIVSGLRGTESIIGSGASLLENGSRIAVADSAHASL